jgi:hypothetical protein
MHWTTVVGQAAKAAAPVKRASKKSIALTTYFQHPDFNMKTPEILCRGTAFLLGIGPPEPETAKGPYGHLEAAEKQRKEQVFKSIHNYTPLGRGDRPFIDMGWFEFVPRDLRPQVHVVAASHVLSPFLWRDFYPQPWLAQVRQEHCSYAVEVYDEENYKEPLAKLALNSTPIHHPEGRDLSLIHFREEESCLKILKSLGVEKLYLRDPDKLYEKGETMYFEGFSVDLPTDYQAKNVPAKDNKKVVKDDDDSDFSDSDDEDDNNKEDEDDNNRVEDSEDLRIFHPYKETGTLAFHTQENFFATTPRVLPEGLCGAPVLDVDGDLCGVVEGIVPLAHKDPRLAGSAAFHPSYILAIFVDYVERNIVKAMMPEDLFEAVEQAKTTNSPLGGTFAKDKDGNFTEDIDWDAAYDLTLNELKKKYSPEEVEAILAATQRERDEVLEIFEKEGGDMNEIIGRVRRKTLEIRDIIQHQMRNQDKPAQDNKFSK